MKVGDRIENALGKGAKLPETVSDDAESHVLIHRIFCKQRDNGVRVVGIPGGYPALCDLDIISLIPTTAAIATTVMVFIVPSCLQPGKRWRERRTTMALEFF